MTFTSVTTRNGFYGAHHLDTLGGRSFCSLLKIPGAETVGNDRRPGDRPERRGDIWRFRYRDLKQNGDQNSRNRYRAYRIDGLVPTSYIVGIQRP